MQQDSYIRAKINAGLHLHLHDGVFWETTRWGYCKPAIPFQEVQPKIKRPARLKTLLGYSHRINDSKFASGHLHALIMPKTRISTWSLENSVDAKRRNAIRKGLRINQVSRIENIDPFREDMTAIAISTAIRNKRGLQPDYYRDQNDQWWQSMIRVSTYSELWATFYEGRMIAYLSVQVAGRLAVIDGAKSMTEHLNVCPNDALVYSFVDSCRERTEIQEIWYGHWSEDKPTLNDFKLSFGFERQSIPFYRKALCGFVTTPQWLNERFATS